MAEFPKDETSTIILAQKVANGIRDNDTTFPTPPVAGAALLGDLDLYFAKNAEIQAAKAATRLKVQEKNTVYARIRSGTRDNIDYAAIVAKGNEAILDLVSWGNPAPGQRLALPGQSRAFEIIGQGDGWMRTDWKEPIDGGEVASYIVRRSEDGVNFVDAATVTASDAVLFNQPTGKKLIYMVVAINRAGEGLPSNTVVISF
ncbi:hypothetical protein BH10ACI1_BH10ACI1_19860 [soil metagenome]